MSDITLIDDSEQSSLVTNGLAKNGEMYLKKAGSTNAGSIVVYDSGAWKTFANEYSASFANAYSVDFDGVDDYLTLASELTLAAPFSLSFWIKPANSNVFLTATSVGSSYIYFNNGNLIFRGGGGEVTTTTYTSNVWQHFAFTLDGSNNLEVYKNGSATGPYSYTSSAGWQFKDVGRYKTNTFFLNGYCDELSVFNSALSSSDVSSLIDATGSNPVPADISSLSPIHWWRMGDNDNGTGTTVTDQGSGSSNLSFVNSPAFSSEVPS